MRRAPDLYALTAEQLVELDGFQQRSAENVIASIAALARAAVRPRAVRRSASRTWAASPPRRSRSTSARWPPCARPGRTRSPRSRASGPIVAESVAAWLAFPANAEVLDDLAAAGLSLELTGDAPAARRGAAGAG